MRFMGIDSDIDRPRVQALRASPPGLAANAGARRRVFGAALGQWDALLGASGAVVPAASPILLFMPCLRPVGQCALRTSLVSRGARRAMASGLATQATRSARRSSALMEGAIRRSQCSVG